MMQHLLPPPDPPDALTESATRAASVNASLTPRFRFAEHSARFLSMMHYMTLRVTGLTGAGGRKEGKGERHTQVS